MRYIYIPLKEISEEKVKPFESRLKKKVFKGFVIRRGADFFAFENLCQHLPVTLDLNDGEFLSFDGRYIQCQMHGALYEKETGLCIGGPCVGKKLIHLETTVEGAYLKILLLKD